jgi:hypothetical protein
LINLIEFHALSTPKQFYFNEAEKKIQYSVVLQI